MVLNFSAKTLKFLKIDSRDDSWLLAKFLPVLCEQNVIFVVLL